MRTVAGVLGWAMGVALIGCSGSTKKEGTAEIATDASAEDVGKAAKCSKVGGDEDEVGAAAKFSGGTGGWSDTAEKCPDVDTTGDGGDVGKAGGDDDEVGAAGGKKCRKCGRSKKCKGLKKLQCKINEWRTFKGNCPRCNTLSSMKLGIASAQASFSVKCRTCRASLLVGYQNGQVSLQFMVRVDCKQCSNRNSFLIPADFAKVGGNLEGGCQKCGQKVPFRLLSPQEQGVQQAPESQPEPEPELAVDPAAGDDQ